MPHARLIELIQEECKQLQENLQTLIEKKEEIEKLQAKYIKESALLTQTVMELSRKQQGRREAHHINASVCQDTRSNRNGSPSRKDKENIKGKWNWD
jgi:transposase